MALSPSCLATLSFPPCPGMFLSPLHPPPPAPDVLVWLRGSGCPIPSTSLLRDVLVPPQRPLSLQTKFNEDFTVKAEGKGKGTMTVVTIYNAKVPDKDNKCDSFDLQVQVEDVKTG